MSGTLATPLWLLGGDPLPNRTTFDSSEHRRHMKQVDNLEFAREYTPADDVHALDLVDLSDRSITLFSCRRNGEVVGIGALRQLASGHVEVKSMHTAEAARGQGIGRAMLNHMLEVATARGARRVSLETGSMDAFAPARALYADAGFQPCGPFGDYPRNRGNTFMTMVLGIDEPDSSTESEST